MTSRAGESSSPATPGGCWAHFSHLVHTGYRTLVPGQRISLEWEQPGQDGYPYRAFWVRAGGDGRADPRDRPAGGAYASRLHIDDPTETSEGV